MITLTDYSGISLLSESIKVVTRYSGLSILSEPVKVLTDYSGVSIIQEWTLRVRVIDTSTTQVISSFFNLVNTSNVVDPYSNFDTSSFLEHYLTIDNPSNLTFTVNISGYILKVENYMYSSGVEFLDIFVDPVPSVLFTCSTIFKNQFGSTVTRPLTDGYVEVTFQGNTDFNIVDYSVLFEAIPAGSSKYNSILLDSELIASTTNSVTYKVAVVQSAGDYCYLSNITKAEC